MRKILLLLAAVCCAVMMNAVNYSLQVAGIQVTDANCSDILNDGKVSYDDATKTLTLNNASITVTSGTAIFIMAEMKIQLLGNNTITLNHSNAGYSGIYSLAKTTIYHESKNWSAASLTITTHNGNNTPIAVYGDLDILGPIDLKVYGYSSMGQIYATNLNINGASIYFDRGDKESVSGAITIDNSVFRNGVYVDAGGKFFRNSNGTKMDALTHVWLDTMLRKLLLSVKKADKGNIAFLNGTPLKTDIKTMIPVGETIELKALPAPDHEFLGWYDSSNKLLSTNVEYNPLMPNETSVIYADFQYIGAESKELTGRFSIAAGKQIVFAPGNLQYQPFTHLFRFAASQDEAIGSGNMLINDASVEWFDLFGWGTGDNPARISTSSADYATWTDWGANPIVNGGNEANQWRTLTDSEWIHLFGGRTDANLKWGVGIVNGVKGMILLPDDFSALNYITPHNTSFSDNKFNETTSTTWNWMEQHGVVFLPLTGYRNGTSMNQTSTQGWYWSSTPESDNMANHIKIAENGINYSTASKYYGQAVRLVQEVSGQQGIEEPTSDSSQKGRGKKLIKDGQLLIERNGKIYNALGTEIQ